MRRFKRIMVASDLSKVSKGALNTAIVFAQSKGAELIIVHRARSDRLRLCPSS